MTAQPLWNYFEKISDPRRGQGRRYSLPAMLGIVIAATLSGRKTLRGIVRWGKKLLPEQLRELGIERGRAPCHSAMHDLFAKLPVQGVEDALGEWIQGQLDGKAPGQIAIDGKTLRASKSAEYPALHLLSAFCVDIHGVLREEAVGEKANEITAAKAMLRNLPLKGAMVTGDAMFCQKELCQQILEGGGHFIFTVKDNQPGLKENVATTFGVAFSPCGGHAG